jgi:hypothetical protein
VDEIRWPEPRQDPDQEPSEPWARHGARPWRELLKEVGLAPDEEADPESELQQ